MENQSWRPCWRLGETAWARNRWWKAGGGGQAQAEQDGSTGGSCGRQPHAGQSGGVRGWRGRNGLRSLGHPDFQSWKQNRASPRLAFMSAQPAKNLPLVLPAPARSAETTGIECPWMRRPQLPAWGRTVGFLAVRWQNFYSWEKVVKRPHDQERVNSLVWQPPD